MTPPHDLMQQAVMDNVFPGGILLYARGADVLFHRPYGLADLNKRNPVTLETFFDLASLTKPLATTLAVLKLVEFGKLKVSDRLGDIIGTFKGTDKEHITIRNLLCHNSGLPAHKHYYRKLSKMPWGDRQNMLKDFLVREPLEYDIESSVIYSDIGFMILAWVIETKSGMRLDSFVDKEIYSPLKIRDLFFPGVNTKEGTRNTLKKEFAVTELCPIRKIFMEGVVHDDNAYCVGGIQGHAGLFGTSGSVHQLLNEILVSYAGCSKNKVLRKDLLQAFLKREKWTGRALGFDIPGMENSSAGKFFSDNSVGHLGFTGTSFWMDLERSIIIVLLTNRIHPTRENEKIRKFRPEIHDAVMENLLRK